MVHIIKVYFTGPKQNVQIRRLAVNSDIVSRFDLLSRKIQEMFPGLAQGHVEVTWKDSENDVIHMSTDEELAQALANAEDDILRLYAYSTGSQQCDENENLNFKSSHSAVHQNVICDGCDKTIQGYRYKCLQCPNFDLCSACNAANKHESHDMIKLVRPTHISREWIFPGARKIWRSMFGRCPRFSASFSTDENEEAAKSESKSNQWPGILEDLLKGGCVSADKIIKDNLGNFVNFLESVSGNLDVKIEKDPRSTRCTRKQDNKTDQNINNGSACAESVSAAAPCHSADSVPKESSEPVILKTEEQLSNSVASDAVEKEKPVENEKSTVKENSADPFGLFSNQVSDQTKTAIEVASILVKSFIGENDASASGDSTEQKQTENLAKPCGLFGDNESSDGWTILNKQEAEKNDAKSVNDTGAKPKYPSIYPSVFEKAESCEVPQVNTETKVKEVTFKQSDVAEVLPKPAVKEEDDNDKQAKLDQNQNTTATYDSEIMNALMKMQAMGFTNEGGWLERLLITKHGNINETLDALYPNTRRR